MYEHVGCSFGSLPARSRAAALDAGARHRGRRPADGRDARVRRGGHRHRRRRRGRRPTSWPSAGHAVVLLEEGEYHAREDFTGRAADDAAQALPRHGRDARRRQRRHPDPARPRRRRHARRSTPAPAIARPTRIFEQLARRVRPGRLSPSAWRRTTSASRRCSAWRRRRANYLGGVGARHRARLRRARLQARGRSSRNAPDCDGQGVCCFGCPTDAKRSTNVSYVPLALKAGAKLFTGRARPSGSSSRTAARSAWSRARRHGARSSRCARARWSSPAARCSRRSCSRQRRRRVARAQLGRNLSIHPAAGAMALFDEAIDGGNAHPAGLRHRGVPRRGPPVRRRVRAARHRRARRSRCSAPRSSICSSSYDRLACFGFMIEDTSRGRVRAGPGRPAAHHLLAQRSRRGAAQARRRDPLRASSSPPAPAA